MASKSVGGVESSGGNKNALTTSIYKPGWDIWKSKGWSLVMMLGLLFSSGMRYSNAVHNKTNQQVYDGLVLLSWIVLSTVAWCHFFYLQRRTRLKFDSLGMTLTDRLKPKLFIAWANIVSVDIYDGYSLPGTRVAVNVTDLEQCFEGLTDKQKKRASKHFIYGPHLICFSTQMLKVKAWDIAREVQKRAAASVTRQGKVESILVTEEFEYEPLVAAAETSADRRYWGLSNIKKVVSGTVGAMFLVFFWLTWAEDKYSHPTFYITLGLIFATAVVALVCFTIGSPFIAIDSKTFSFKDWKSRKASIPFSQIAGTFTQIDLNALQRSISICVSGRSGSLNGLPKDTFRHADLQGNEQAVVTFWPVRMRALPQEIQPELRRGMDGALGNSSLDSDC